MDNYVQLEEYADEEYLNEIDKCIEYPCVFMIGVSSEEELEFFQNRCTVEDASVPLYTRVEGTPIRMGSIELTIEYLLMVRSIFNYELLLHRDENDTVVIDLNDPYVLQKFIRL